ncbi:MAG: glycoside hydrolase family 3 protein [Lachnospiraceae bacterium]|nr:glycoside hydrolase family 3 protein [Lachnospiraceae bacterium]
MRGSYKHLLRMGKRLCAVFLSLTLVLALTACGFSKKADGQIGAKESSTEFAQRDPEKLDDITMEGLTGELIKEMTLKEKVGQLFMLSTDNLDYNAETAMTETMKENITKYKPGGVIMFSFNIKNRQQTMDFIQAMQKQSEIPMLIGVDEEGGKVARIGNTDSMGTTKFPPMAVIGKTGDKKEAYKVGKTIGKEIGELGFNVDFAPVADITTNENNTEIGERSFGSDKELVSKMVAAEVKGLESQNVSATLKHFPGQGDLEEDTHRGYANLGKTIDLLRKTEFAPFRSGIDAGADFVMVSHASVKNVTESHNPSSLSHLIVSDILRDELNFDGVIITDAMNMKSITKFYDADEAAVKAVKAGNDIVLMPDDFPMAYQGILDAVKEGELSEDEIDKAVQHILTVKIRRGMIPLSSQLFSVNRSEKK